MSIRHAILGLLAEQPTHGYRLKRIFENRVSPIWGLTTGQVYQSLAALERNALVESRSQRRGRRPCRRIYSITPAGKRELADWLSQPPVWLRSLRDEVVLRLMIIGEEGATRLWSDLGKQIDETTALLGQIGRLRQQSDRPSNGIDLVSVFLESARHRLEADIKSLELFRGELTHLAPATDRPGA